MSSSNAIALITASSFSGIFCYYYTTKMANDLGAELVAGVVRGNPVSMKYRWIMLHQTWVGYAIGAIACGVVVAVVNVKIAQYATDPGVRPAAYLVAFLGALAAISWLLFGASELLLYRSMLREAELD